MNPVFISYSSKHRDLTERLAEVIEAQYGPDSVWWDHALESRATYSNQIKAALEKARVVVVIWTAGATVSEYVYAEAISARDLGKLVNVRPSDVSFRDIPEPFNVYHIDDADDDDGILATIASVMAGKPIPTRVPLHELFFRQHGQRLIDHKRSRLPRDLAEASPTDLLQARYEVVDYIDFAGMRAEFVDWCMKDSCRVAGRLAHGPGGVGKTRMMISLARKLRDEHGWTAGFLERPHEQADATLALRRQALDQLIAHGDDNGLLLVIDYAEARQDEVTSLANHLDGLGQKEAPRPIRVVLLARSAGEWWSSLHDEVLAMQRLFRETLDDPCVVALERLDGDEARLALLDASLQALADPLRAQGFEPPATDISELRRKRIGSDDGYARPLAVQMEALLWLASRAPDNAATGIDVLLRRVLGLERSHWKKLLGGLDEDEVRDLSRAVAQMTLVRGVGSRASAEQLLMADRFYEGQSRSRASVDPLCRRLLRIHGTASGGIGPLEPDLVGEHHVATVSDADLVDACLEWTGGEVEGIRQQRRRDLLTVLQRATRPEHGPKAARRGEVLIDHVITEHLQALGCDLMAVASETPGALVERLERQVDRFDMPTLDTLHSALPHRSLALMSLSLGVAKRRVAQAREQLASIDGSASDTDPDACEDALNTLGGRVGTLGNRLSNLGRREEALAASEEAVAIRRQLAETRPDTYLPDLAMSLNNLGIRLSNLGRREEALAASEEAVAIYRQMAETRPDAFLPDLAMSLNNLGIRLSNLGRREEALAASEEAVSIRRRLAETRPDAFLPDFAGSLNNTGAMLSNLGRREEALAASEEAVAIYRQLAERRPDAFLPDLASSLNNTGAMLSNLGRREEALAASEEAVAIYRQLAERRPDAFLPDLAMSLNNLGGDLSNLGRREEALAATEEAVAIYRQLAKTRPDAFLPDVAMSLNNLGIRLSNLGRREEALAASEEAVSIRRQLAETRPDAFLPDLASSLHNLGGDLSNLGRREKALAASEEAVSIRRQLAETRPDAFLPDLASSLNNLGIRLSNLGRREEALAASEEAVAIYRQLAETRPDAFLPDLAMSLNSLGIRLSKLGRREEALAASEEAVAIRRQLAETRPDAFLPDLAGSLNNTGAMLSNLGHREEALAATEEAVVIYRQLAETRPDAFLPDLAMSLNNLGIRLSKLGRREEALAASKEAVAIRRQLAETRPDAFLPDLASSLNNLGIRLSNLGRREEALAASEEAVSIRRQLAETRPDAFLPDLARSVSVTSDALAELGRNQEASAAAHEALAILAPFVERFPGTFGGLARTIATGVHRYSDAAGESADHALLERVAAVLGDGATD